MAQLSVIVRLENISRLETLIMFFATCVIAMGDDGSLNWLAGACMPPVQSRRMNIDVVCVR